MAKKSNTGISSRKWFADNIFAHFDFDKDGEQLKASSKLNIAEIELLENARLSLCNEQERIIHLLSKIDDEHLQWELSRTIDNIFTDSRIIGKFTEPLPFSKIQADGLRTKNARAAKMTVIEKRREIIKTHFTGTLAKSSACANRVIKQLEDTFKAEGISQYSARTITDDIAAIIKN